MSAPGAGVDGAPLNDLYRLMRLCRLVDEEVVRLQRQGVIAAYPPLSGQEAAQVGSALALAPGDWAFPSYRELGVALVRNVDLVEYLLAYRGDWHGGLYDPRAHRFAMISSSVGSHLLHAVGWAMGARLDGLSDCAIAYFGDGATSEGDFHEAMNFAGVFRAPVVFFCQNNQWAISVPLEQQTAAPIWRKAEAYGFPGEQVDGNDAVAVFEATGAALERARAGQGPTLIEALTYRVGAHSTADDPSRYRTAEQSSQWLERDPIRLLRSRLEERGAEEAFFAEVEASAGQLVAGLRASLTGAPGPDPDDLFKFVYTEPPATLTRQREELGELVALEREEPGA
jgi:pyruvate dehydrogenase E1 component alpha subunit